MRDLKMGLYGPLRRYSAGQYLLWQGEQPDYVYIIHNGAAKLIWHQDGHRITVVGLRWSGWFLGAASCLTLRANPVSAAAFTPMLVEMIPQRKFHCLLETDIEFRSRIELAHSNEILDVQIALIERNTLSAVDRLKKLLQGPNLSLHTELVKHDGRLQLSRDDLASLVGISREHLSRILPDLQTAGIIKLQDRSLTIISKTPKS